MSSRHRGHDGRAPTKRNKETQAAAAAGAADSSPLSLDYSDTSRRHNMSTDVQEPRGSLKIGGGGWGVMIWPHCFQPPEEPPRLADDCLPVTRSEAASLHIASPAAKQTPTPFKLVVLR